MSLDAAQRRAVMAHPAGWIATGLGSGLSPVAPGTFGSAAALLPWLLLREQSLALVVLVIAVSFVVGVVASNFVIAKLHISDPGCIVWDEFVGQWIALLPLLLWPAKGWWIVIGFGLFRLFDIAKPWPISWADRNVKGGLGVMLDDALAGVAAALVLAGLLHYT